MKEFKFEITIKESDIKGDEFWEEALERDGTGILELTELMRDFLVGLNIFKKGSVPGGMVKLTSYKDV